MICLTCSEMILRYVTCFLTLLMYCLHLKAQDVIVQEITYTNTTTVIDCPLSQTFTLPTWKGPPDNTIYTLTGSPEINPALSNLARVSYASNSRSLVITDTQTSDGGTYKCTKNTDSTIHEGWNVITVRIHANNPSITGITTINGRKSIRGTEGVAQTLTCTSAGGYPAPTVVWYKYDSELSRASSGTQVGDTYTVVLTHSVRPTRTDDRQTFTCQSYYPSSAVGLQDLKRESVELYLNLKPVEPIVASIGSPVNGESSQTIARCVTSGFRPSLSINMTMSFRGVTNAYTTAVEDTNTETYSITADYNRAVQKADNGQSLTCSVTHQTLQTPISQSEAIVVKFAPVLAYVTGNTSIVADGINKMYLTCTSGTSNPASGIVWKRQNINITSNAQLQLSTGNYGGQITTQILELTPTRDMYGHIVTCEAENGINGQSAAIDHIKIEIRYNPQLTTRSQPFDLKEGVSSVTLTCTVSSKPDSTIKWYKDGNNNSIKTVSSASSNNVLVHTIHHVQRSHAGGYTCSTNNNIGGDVTSKVQVVVQYAPDVTVTTQNVTVNDSHLDILCSPSGVPASYTYLPWTHAWISDGRTVPLLTKLGSSPTLRLTDLSYQHSGVYTCRASNGVTESIHANAGQGDVYLNVESFPIITEPVVPNGQYHKLSTRLDVYSPTIISVQYYNNGDTPNVNCYKLYNNTRQVSNIYTINSKDVVVQLPVFTQTVNTEGTMATVTMAITQTSQLGLYVIVIKNNIGEGIVPVQIVSEDKPEVPTNIRHIPELTTHSSLTIMWKSGFNGGLVQTFKIEYKEKSDVHWTVKTVQEPATNITLDGLSAGMIYEVRISAYNAIGTSSSIEIEAFKTAEIQLQMQSNNTGLVLGAFVGGIAITVIVIAAIIIFRRQRNLGKCTCSSISNKNSQLVEDVPKDQHVFHNVSPTVQATDDVILNETDCDTGITTYESTISSNPKEHVYTDLKAHPQGVSNSQKGMEMYENLKI